MHAEETLMHHVMDSSYTYVVRLFAQQQLQKIILKLLKSRVEIPTESKVIHVC